MRRGPIVGESSPQCVGRAPGGGAESEASSGGCLLGDRAQRRFEPRRLEDVRMEVEDGLAELARRGNQRRIGACERRV